MMGLLVLHEHRARAGVGVGLPAGQGQAAWSWLAEFVHLEQAGFSVLGSWQGRFSFLNKKRACRLPQLTPDSAK
jgi:hypothetical protein